MKYFKMAFAIGGAFLLVAAMGWLGKKLMPEPARAPIAVLYK